MCVHTNVCTPPVVNLQTCSVCDLGCCQVPGEASETDSEGEEEEEEEQAGRASAPSQESAQILRRDLPPLIVVRDHPDIQSIVEDMPSPTHRPHGEDNYSNTYFNDNIEIFLISVQLHLMIFTSEWIMCLKCG